MRTLIVLLLALFTVGCGETNWGPTPVKPCESYQSNYSYTTIVCGDYYDDVVVLCDENSNYNRGHDCLKMSDVYTIVADNKPCADCGCVTQNVCDD